MRRIARQLVFASVRLLRAPRSGAGVAPLSAAGDWQLIFGRSLAQTIGSDAATYELVRTVRPGRIVSVEPIPATLFGDTRNQGMTCYRNILLMDNQGSVAKMGRSCLRLS